jgi:hypothetical protein
MSLIDAWGPEPQEPQLNGFGRRLRLGWYVGSRDDREHFIARAMSHNQPLSVVCFYSQEIPLPEEATSFGITQRFVELDDAYDEDLRTTFSVASQAYEDAKKAQRPLLLHCAQGISRSVTAAISVLMQCDALPLRDACVRVRQARGIGCPNLGFLNQLVFLESTVFRRKAPSDEAAEDIAASLEEDVFRNPRIGDSVQWLPKPVTVGVEEYLASLPGIAKNNGDASVAEYVETITQSRVATDDDDRTWEAQLDMEIEDRDSDVERD